MIVVGYSLFLFIGIILGLIGGGGSILAVPVLVYLFLVPPEIATGYSLFIVGLTSFIGSFNYIKRGLLSLEALMLFALPSLVSVYVVRKFVLPVMPDQLGELFGITLTKSFIIMAVFAGLLIASSLYMLIPARQSESKETMWEEFSKSPIKIPFVIIIGIVVGALSGFVGAGGGFMIIPALVLVLRVSMKNAIGTSLSIIAINCTIGFLGNIGSFEVDWKFISILAVLSIAGIIIGGYLSNYINGKKLRPAFGWFTLVIGAFIVVKEIFIK